jgi:DNA-binding protein YbaB
MNFQFLTDLKLMKHQIKTTDEEFDQISVSYTSGGLTATVSQTNADNVTGATLTEQSKWNVGLSFAF